MKMLRRLGVVGACSLSTALCAVAAEPAPLAAVAPADLTKVKPADFTDDELDLPYYLTHFHVLANAVEGSGPNRGHIAVSVWRGNANVFNARIMENILSLAWFYCTDRPWNPYRGDPALRARLEAALTFWSSIQSNDGQFSEYGPQQWNLAATAFATKFGGEALLLLHQKSAPLLDATVLARADETLRRAIVATLTLPALYEHGRTYTNQFGNVWPGGLAYFEFHPDAELRALWGKRFHESRADFQSPAGYYYERDGPDFGYTMDTHGHNTRQAWSWLIRGALGDELIAKETAWFQWLAYNASPEPDFSGFVLNRAIETRQKHADFPSYDSPLGEFIPLVRAFAESREERVARLARERGQLEEDWPKVAPLPVGQFWAYSPYAFLHRRLHEWQPMTVERDRARHDLPMLARDRFVHQFADSRKAVVFTFVRRPGYYAAFNAGEKVSEQQRYGLGLVWTPQLGAVLQSQTASATAAWGTRAAGAGGVYEAGSITAPPATPGSHELRTPEFAASYPLGDRGVKTLKFETDAIVVAVKHAGEFAELLPLLVPADGRVELAAGRAMLKTPRGDFVIHFDSAAQAALSDAPGAVLSKHLVVLTLRAKDQLDYTLGAK